MQLYSQPMKMMGLRGPDKIEAEAFFENADDIINEEEYEESIINQSIRKNDDITRPPLLESSIEHPSAATTK
jgi:hypothetical protein